ncbi:SIR2 family protein [Lysinibacillus fusiformis]|nr:SIR2 family protein [Lysinibacillus fusiformis]
MLKRNVNIEAIKEAKDANKLVIFIGAGVSANSGLPSWTNLVKVFAKKLGIDRDLNTDDYLRIPQYFYNERGQLEYFKVIEQVFSGRYAPNLIHSKLLSLNPKHIITTNYDYLIEEALEAHYLFYDKVAEDRDIPYASSNNLYIKMHGDLLKKNIVLKEDDYLYYSDNFKLIENYVESIFINHTVLFIGYSMQDYDLKLLIKRLQSTIGNDFRTAYLIESSNTVKSSIEKEYLKRFGINVIDIKDVPEDYKGSKEKIGNSHGDNLLKILNYIEDYNTDNKEELGYFFAKWRCYKDLKAIRVYDLFSKLEFNSLNFHFRSENCLELTCIGSDEIYLMKFIDRMNEISEMLKKEQSSQIKDYDEFIYINEIMAKANVKKIVLVIRGDFKNREIKFYETFMNMDSFKPELIELIEQNNYLELENRINDIKYNLNADFYNSWLSLSFAYTHFNKYVSAYEQLENISLKAYKEKNYSMYYLAAFNKKMLSRLLPHPGTLLSRSLGEDVSITFLNNLPNVQVLDKEVNESFLQLSKEEKANFEFLQKLHVSKGLIDDIQKVVKKSNNKIKSNLNTEFILGSQDIELPKLRSTIYDFYRYTTYNYLIVKYYTEVVEVYSDFLDALVSTYLNLKKSEEFQTNNKKFSSIIEPYQFEYLDLILITNSLSEKDINKIFDNYNVTSIMFNGPTIVVRGLLKNLINSFCRYSKAKQLDEKLKSTFAIAKRIPLDIEDLRDIISTFTSVIQKRPINDSIYTSFLDFIRCQSKILEMDSELFINFVNVFLNKLSNPCFNNPNGFEMSLIEREYFLRDFIFHTPLSKESHSNIELSPLLKELEYGFLKGNYLLINEMLLDLYRICTKENQTRIEESIRKQLRLEYNIMIYLKAVLNNIEPIINEFDAAFQVDLINLKANGEYKITYEMYLLAINNREKQKEVLLKLKGLSDHLDFFIELENYDFKNKSFELSWLCDLPEEHIQKISGEFCGFIKNRFKDEFIVSQKLSVDLLMILFKYFYN